MAPATGFPNASSCTSARFGALVQDVELRLYDVEFVEEK